MASLVTRLAAVPARQRIGSTCWLLTKASQSNSSATQSQATPTTAFSRLRGLRSSPASFSAPAARRFYSSEQNSSGSSAPPPPPPPPPKPSSIKFWPFVVVIAMGTGGYILLVNQRLGTLPPQEKQQKELNERGTPLPSFKLRSTPTFSPEDVTVVFVLGGPGAGKGTQCARLVKQYGFAHLSAGDLLRAEQDRPGSQFGQLIRDCIRNGEIVPMEVTIQLLENAMRDVMKSSSAKQHKFLIDGFPRKMDQAVAFEQAVCPAKLVLFFDCPESELERRLMERGKTSGRDDDNAASIRKRFRTFVETSMPVVDAFAAEGRVVTIDATPKPDAVFAATQKQLAKQLGI